MQKIKELEHFVAFLEKVPEFAGTRIISFDPDEAPDVICHDEGGKSIGVEVTQWLMAKQKKIADQWDVILSAASMSTAVPQNVSSITFSFQSSFHFFLECNDCGDFLSRLSMSGRAAPLQTSAINSYSEYTRCAACQLRLLDLISQRPDLENEIRSILTAIFTQVVQEKRLGSVNYEIPRGMYRIADDYSLRLVKLNIEAGQLTRSQVCPTFELVGAYAPGIAAAALTHRLDDKLNKRSYRGMRVTKGLSKALLLIVYDEAISDNTPFRGSSPIDVASTAAKQWAGLFDGIFLLLYPNNPLEPYEVVPGLVFGGRECYQIYP
jgi:hypothetical protein